MSEPVYFVTGYPGFLARRLVRRLLQKSGAKAYALVHPEQQQAALAAAQGLPSNQLTLLTGDVGNMHLGLSGAEYIALARSVTHIFHLAAVMHAQLPRREVFRVNLEGTRNVLELAAECTALERLVHFSTILVSGDRNGVISESELDCGQKFRSVYEESKFEAEKLLHHHLGQIPITILRPATVVGDSRSGEIDRFDGPYYMALWLTLSPLALPLPLPGDGMAPLNVVPVDFVVEAAQVLAHDPRASGKTLHLVDPNPMSARRVYELIAQKRHRRLPRISLSAKLADRLMRLPLLERWVRPQRAAIQAVNHHALYSCHQTIELLDGTGVRCPPLHAYLDTLISYASKHFFQSDGDRSDQENLWAVP